MILELHQVVRLTDSEEDISIMRFEKRMTVVEIAHHTGMANSSVRGAIHRVQLKMRQFAHRYPQWAPELDKYKAIQRDLRFAAKSEASKSMWEKRTCE